MFPNIHIFRKPIRGSILNFTHPFRSCIESLGAATSPLASLEHHAAEDLSIPGQENLGSHRQPLQEMMRRIVLIIAGCSRKLII